MSGQGFFEESREQSIVKTTIVSKYFWAWAKVLMPTAKKVGGKIAYLDLFAGPGRYLDGKESTPLLILQQAIADPEMRQMLVTLFNDKDEKHSRELDAAIKALPDVGLLKHQPTVLNEEVGTEMVKQFQNTKMVPTLFFVDPWGYKGLSLQLVNSVLKDWGCDCIFFFNYNRISMGLSNPVVEEHMNALFGKVRADELPGRKAPSMKCSMGAIERSVVVVIRRSPPPRWGSPGRQCPRSRCVRRHRGRCERCPSACR